MKKHLKELWRPTTGVGGRRQCIWGHFPGAYANKRCFPV